MMINDFHRFRDHYNNIFSMRCIIIFPTPDFGTGLLQWTANYLIVMSDPSLFSKLHIIINVCVPVKLKCSDIIINFDFRVLREFILKGMKKILAFEFFEFLRLDCNAYSVKSS